MRQQASNPEGELFPRRAPPHLFYNGQAMHSIRKRKDQQKAFLKHFKISLNIEKAAKEIGVSKNSINRWMKDDPEFKNKIDAVRREAKEAKAAKERWEQAAKRTQEAKEDEEEKQPFRDFLCVGYFACLRTNAIFGDNAPMICTACSNRRHKIPKRIPTSEYLAMLTEDTVCCTRLLHAIFYPEKYYHHHDTRQSIVRPMAGAQ